MPEGFKVVGIPCNAHVYSRSQGFSGRRCLDLERFAGGCDLRSITAGVQTTPEDSSVQPQLSEHLCYLNFSGPISIFHT